MTMAPQTAFDPLDGRPVTIVFGTFNYRAKLRQWIAAAASGTCRHWRILCMDRELRQWLVEAGYGPQAIDYYAVLPDAPRHDFATLARKDLMKALMPLRTRLFLHLANAGRDFIHSDADALWVRDPHPWLARHSGFDLLVSQGLEHPVSHYRRHRFVLCAGFFLCRANARTLSYFEKVESREHWDDQVRMNEVLLADPEGRWTMQESIPLVRREGRWRARSNKDWLHLLLEWARVRERIPHIALPRSVRDFRFLVTSRQVMCGQFAGGLTVGVIPWHLVVRRMPITSETLVQHAPPPAHAGRSTTGT